MWNIQTDTDNRGEQNRGWEAGYTDGQYMADLVRQQRHGAEDFFIFAASGTNDFAYSAFKAQIMAMGNDSDGMFTFANNESDGNLSFREREGYSHDSSQWDGNYDAIVESRTPVYFAIGEHDEYYGSEPSVEAYNAIRTRYEEEGLTEQEINRLLVLDVKPDSYFEEGGVTNQHGGGDRLFVRDEAIMGWLFGQLKTQS